MVKIVSWNVNSIRVRLPHLIELDKSVKPDIVMLQETKSTDENFPEEEISSLGYQIIKRVKNHIMEWRFYQKPQ